MSKQPAKQPAKKDDTLKPGQYLEADDVIIRYMGPKTWNLVTINCFLKGSRSVFADCKQKKTR